MANKHTKKMLKVTHHGHVNYATASPELKTEADQRW